MLKPSARYAAAAALRGDADAQTVAPLVRRLTDTKGSAEEARIFAFALGSVCDRAPRHWSARLAAAIDYRSATTRPMTKPSKQSWPTSFGLSKARNMGASS